MTHTAQQIQYENSREGIEKQIRYEKITQQWKKEREMEIAQTMKMIDRFITH